MVRLRKPLPPYTLQTPEGGKVYLPDLKGRPLVLLKDEALARGLALREAELEALGAQAYLLAQTPGPHPSPSSWTRKEPSSPPSPKGAPWWQTPSSRSTTWAP